MAVGSIGTGQLGNPGQNGRRRMFKRFHVFAASTTFALLLGSTTQSLADWRENHVNFALSDVEDGTASMSCTDENRVWQSVFRKFLEQEGLRVGKFDIVPTDIRMVNGSIRLKSREIDSDFFREYSVDDDAQHLTLTLSLVSILIQDRGTRICSMGGAVQSVLSDSGKVKVGPVANFTFLYTTNNRLSMNRSVTNVLKFYLRNLK